MRQRSTQIDKTDRTILEELQVEGRISFSELGRRVGLSTPALIERVHRLEDAGVIIGYRAEVDPAKVGLPVQAVIKLTLAGEKVFSFAKIAAKIPEILECHRVTGAESYILQVAVRDVPHMKRVIDSLMPYVASNTSLILGSPVRSRFIVPACSSDETTNETERDKESTIAGKKRRDPSRKTWRAIAAVTA